jgi:flagellar biosynthesis chaperone FliJ
MNNLLTLLRKTRDARKEAALAKLSAAKNKLAHADAALDVVGLAFREAQALRRDLMRRNGAGLAKDWRDTILPSCQSLIAVRARAVMQASKLLDEHKQQVDECRAALMRCEKALMRTDELRDIVKAQTNESQRLQEQSNDDDLALTYKPPLGACIGSPKTAEPQSTAGLAWN